MAGDGDDVYVSKWRYMTELSFLSAHVCPRNKTISNLSAAKVRCVCIFYSH